MQHLMHLEARQERIVLAPIQMDILLHLYSASRSKKPYRCTIQRDSLLENRHVLTRAREVENLEERKVLQVTGGRRFHREGPITVKDLDLTIVVLAQGTNRSRPVYP